MTATNLYRLVNFALRVTALVTISTALIAFALPFFDEHLLTTWQIAFENSAEPYHAVLPAGEWGVEKAKGLCLFKRQALVMQ